MSAARYPAIGAHGLIGDRRTAALVSADGTIDWSCLPQFDGDIVFGALLDGTRGGRWRLGPRQALEGEQQYLDETALLLTRWTLPEWEVELLDAMLLPDDAADQPQSPALLRRLRCARGVCPCIMELGPRLNFAAAVPVGHDTASGRDTPGAALHLWTSRQEVAASTDENGGSEFELREGDELWTVLSWGSAPQPPWRLEDARAALERTASSWRHWARLHPWMGPQRRPVLASQRVIRLLSDAQNSSQVAAPTTSLPERIGGDRNYDYRFAWVRDSPLALAILAVFGDLETAEHYMDWLAGRPPGDEMPLKLLYRIDGPARPGSGTSRTSRDTGARARCASATTRPSSSSLTRSAISPTAR